MKSLLQKTSQFTVFMILFGTLFPILAFAATGFENVTYRNGTVSGSVYSDVYEPTITEAVYIYDPSGNFAGAATTTGVTYSVYEGVYTYHYGFTANVSNSFSYLNLLEKVTDSVYQAVYNSTPGDSRGGRGGGGGAVPVPSGATLNVSGSGEISAGTLAAMLQNFDTVELVLDGETALIPAKALADYVSTDKVLQIKNSHGIYILPLSVLNLSELARELGIEAEDMMIKVTIGGVSETTAADIEAAAAALGASVAGSAADFDIACADQAGNTQAIDFGNKYIRRVLPIAKTIDSGKATGVLYNPVTKKLSFVPSVFESKEEGRTDAVLMRNGSSIYTVIELNKSFGDISGHWAQSYVELLANKLVVDGVTDTRFEPDRNISRAEFAALVVRSLGLGEGSYANTFKDVSSGAWYAGVIGAAVNAKLIDGYEDGTFRPDGQISREELAAMVVRALDYAGVKPDLSSDQEAAMLGKFKDAGRIVWAQKELAAAIYAGIVDGMTDDTIGSNLQATRAQSATMLKRLLSNAQFIN